jgi:DNA polymerase-3 subunit gamma/tau
MFENLIAQPARDLLVDDITASRLPPSMLFSGQGSSGKLTAALELARILSCKEGKALWTCTCSSCLRHKLLSHPDLLVMGARDCILEIRAASASFLKNRGLASRYLFIRSVKKLVIRFNAELWDLDDNRFSKAASLLSDIDERLEELDPSRSLSEDGAVLEKMVVSIADAAEKLEEEFLYDSIPVSQVRNASSWARLSPAGKKKVLIIENADRMQEGARNAFLKVLEEPPADVVFILTTARRGAIMPTILSRVRTYAFVDRNVSFQHEVIVRVFHDTPGPKEILSDYFNRFLPVSPEKIGEAAGNFLDVLLLSALDEGRRPLPGLRTVLPGSGRDRSSATASAIVSGLNKCKPIVIYHLFLSRIARFMREALRSGLVDARETAVFTRWTFLLREALDAVDIYNLGVAAALEQLKIGMKDAL